MKTSITLLLLFGLGALSLAAAEGGEEIYLATEPALSPNGKTLAFAWAGDIWSVPVSGGEARQLTRHPARDSEPCFSPDGKEIAFTSDRDGGRQVYVMPAEGGVPDRLTFHSDGYGLLEWSPDGKALLAGAVRDYGINRRNGGRLFLVGRNERGPDNLLFDATAGTASLSPDGKRVLFTREGSTSWRKGYRGSRASQIWLYDMAKKEYTKLLDDEGGSRSPLWKPNGKGFYYVGARSGSFNLWEYDLGSGDQRRLTRFEDDSVASPCISRDGKTVVFRHLFDFYRFDPRKKKKAERITIGNPADGEHPRKERKILSKASRAAFTGDGLEAAFIAGRDLWVMDTELREPIQVTATSGEETNPLFTPGGEALLFIGDREGTTDIWRARRSENDKFWWQNETFKIDRLTTDTEVESRLTFSPDGEKIAYVKGRGDLWIADADGRNAERLIESPDAPDYDWSPDGKWIVYTVEDKDFNRDVWVVPLDRSSEPYNLSRHPDDESNPVWSPDGKTIAFTGRRVETEVDIYYLYLTKGDHETGKRDRSIEKAIEKINKVRKPKKKDGATTKTLSGDEPTTGSLAATDEPTTAGLTAAKTGEKEKKKLPKVEIDFDRIHERLRRVSIPDANERGLFWSHDSKKLAFSAKIDGKSGTYTIEFPDELKPKLLSEKTGSGARWIKEGNQVVWLSDGIPASLSATGKSTAYPFKAKWEVDLEDWRRAGFVKAWRLMRDNYYDESLGGRDWDKIREKYEDRAATARDAEVFGSVVTLMLGELNGSHLGFHPAMNSWRPDDQWREETAHLGLRFDRDYTGPGLRVRDVLPEGPTDRAKSTVRTGETLLAVDGTSVTASMDPTTYLNGLPDRDVELTVADEKGERRRLTIRPISYSTARRLVEKKTIEDRRKIVDDESGGAMGYLYIPGMNWSSFLEFEREIYAQGAGKEGLVIDVRDNGGGFTTDHLLTVLCQPSHAMVIPRGGEVGYPQDRRVYATWGKPIVVLCNQNSFSNAEIFSHAIKTLGRGKVVGVTTGGGVVSTGSANVMDLGTIRMPYRGWFTIGDGEDMELHGAEPHHTVWPWPGDLPQGKDAQLEKAVEVLLKDMKDVKKHPRPKYRVPRP